MADKAHRLTDEKLEEMEKRLSAIYSRAEKEIQKTAMITSLPKPTNKRLRNWWLIWWGCMWNWFDANTGRAKPPRYTTTQKSVLRQDRRKIQ